MSSLQQYLNAPRHDLEHPNTTTRGKHHSRNQLALVKCTVRDKARASPAKGEGQYTLLAKPSITRLKAYLIRFAATQKGAYARTRQHHNSPYTIPSTKGANYDHAEELLQLEKVNKVEQKDYNQPISAHECLICRTVVDG